MISDIRIIEPGQQTDEAVVRARHDFEGSYRRKFGYSPPQEAVDKWWPLCFTRETEASP